MDFSKTEIYSPVFAILEREAKKFTESPANQRAFSVGVTAATAHHVWRRLIEKQDLSGAKRRRCYIGRGWVVFPDVFDGPEKPSLAGSFASFLVRPFPDMHDLLRVPLRMQRNHQQHLPAVHGAADQRVGRQPGARIVFKL